jgi:hypothetical protein
MTLAPSYPGIVCPRTAGVCEPATLSTRQMPVCVQTSPVRNLVPRATRIFPPRSGCPAHHTGKREAMADPAHFLIKDSSPALPARRRLTTDSGLVRTGDRFIQSG